MAGRKTLRPRRIPAVRLEGFDLVVVGHVRRSICEGWADRIRAAFPDGTTLDALYDWVDDPWSLAFAMWRVCIPGTMSYRVGDEVSDVLFYVPKSLVAVTCDDIREAVPLELLIEDLPVNPKVV